VSSPLSYGDWISNRLNYRLIGDENGGPGRWYQNVADPNDGSQSFMQQLPQDFAPPTAPTAPGYLNQGTDWAGPGKNFTMPMYATNPRTGQPEVVYYTYANGYDNDGNPTQTPTGYHFKSDGPLPEGATQMYAGGMGYDNGHSGPLGGKYGEAAVMAGLAAMSGGTLGPALGAAMGAGATGTAAATGAMYGSDCRRHQQRGRSGRDAEGRRRRRCDWWSSAGQRCYRRCAWALLVWRRTLRPACKLGRWILAPITTVVPDPSPAQAGTLPTPGGLQSLQSQQPAAGGGRYVPYAPADFGALLIPAMPTHPASRVATLRRLVSQGAAANVLLGLVASCQRERALAGAGAGALAGAGAAGATSWDRIFNGSATAGDWASITGALAPGVLGYLGSSQATDAYKDLANQYMGFGAPSRARYEASYAPGFDITQADPAVGKAIDASSNALLRGLSTQGNPYGNPGGLMEANKYVTSNVALPALNQYRNQNSASGGLAGFSTAAPAAASGAIQSQGNEWNALGYGLGRAMNPSPSINDFTRAFGIRSFA
jgi:hypothetical protein